MTDWIFQWKSCLIKQTKTSNNILPYHSPKHAPIKVFASEALVAVNCKKADLTVITKNCKDLTEEQKIKLWAVLKWHEPLFQGR